MEVIHKTQFAQFEKDFSKLPMFLQKKFEEAVIANSKKFDADRVKEKLEKAEKNLNEQKQKQQMKWIQKRLNYEENLERGRQAKVTKNEYLLQVQAHKQKTADEVYAEQLSLKINKAQSLGTKKVLEAQRTRTEEDEKRQQRLRAQKMVMNYPNVSVENIRVEKTNHLIVKHYTILKKVNTRNFHSQRESLKKKEELETKLANAESRKQEIINEKIAKAAKAAAKKDYGVKKEPLAEKLLRKQNEAEERRSLVLQTKINKARESYARASTESRSESSQTRGNEDESLKTAQNELKTCYSIITSQKEANLKMMEELNAMKKQMSDLQKQTSYNTKKPIAFTIGETKPSFCTEMKSWEMI